MIKKIGLAFFAIVALLCFVVLIRAAGFKSRQIAAAPIQMIAIDRDAVVRRLSEAIRIKTVSSSSVAMNDAGEFAKLHGLISRAFPLVNRRLSKENVGEGSLLYTWQGKDQRRKPILLMAHMDVVPVDSTAESAWRYPPFSGMIAEGFVWGRGAMDDKASVMAILEAVENLLAKGFEPERTVYLAFGHDEEIGGTRGAAKIAELLRSRNVELESVLDEGLNIFSGLIPGIEQPVALIGIAEKGYLSLQLTVETAGGHSAIPPSRTAIGAISRALERLQSAPFPTRLSDPTREMLEFLGPEMDWRNKLVLANLWLFEPLLKQRLAAAPATNALVRTTAAPTMINAGLKDNVLPSKARATLNLRILPGESTASATEYVRRVVADPRVSITPLPVQVEPSGVTDIQAPAFRTLQQTIRQIMPKALVAPGLLVAATDSRHYRPLSENTFWFVPITVGADDIHRYHGINERIAIEDYERCIRFYAQLIINSNQPTQ